MAGWERKIIDGWMKKIDGWLDGQEKKNDGWMYRKKQMDGWKEGRIKNRWIVGWIYINL